jgi:hypothetical protein
MQNKIAKLLLRIVHIIVGALLVLSTLFQLLAMFGGVLFNEYNNLAVTMPWLVPVWALMLLALVAAYCLLIKKGSEYPWQPILFAVALVSAIVAFIVAITLRDALPEHLNVNGQTQGLTTWRLLYRHMSSVFVGVCLAIEAAVRWILYCHARKYATDNADLADSTIGLDGFAGQDDAFAKPKKPKRSVRRAQKK